MAMLQLTPLMHALAAAAETGVVVLRPADAAKQERVTAGTCLNWLNLLELGSGVVVHDMLIIMMLSPSALFVIPHM